MMLSTLLAPLRIVHRQQRGQMIVVVVLLVPILLGMAGYAIDLGRAAATRRDTQNAADAAALAGADVRLAGGSIDSARSAARSWVQKNRYTLAEATINIPPSTGPHSGDNNYVEVQIQHTMSTSFERVIGISTVAINSRAVAGYLPVPANYALLVLNPTMCSAFNQSSGNTLTIVGGGAMVDSNCHPSANQGGGGSIIANPINYYNEGSWQQSNNASTSSPPTSVAVPIADPLASLVQPVPGASSPDCVGTANNPRVTHITGNSPVTIRPGTCYGGIKITGSGGVTFAPGLFILAGGGFDYSSASSVSGSGVTFFNTYDPSHPTQDGACAPIALQGSGVLTLTAPTSGAYKDMLFWQDPACTDPFKYAGSSWTTTGIIYLPKAQLNLSGGGSLGAMQIIVDSFDYSGSSAVTITYGNYVQIGRPKVALVE